MKTFTLFLALALCAFAADPPKAVAEKPNTISAEHLAEYYRTDAQLAHSQQAADEASRQRNVAIAALIADCGDKLQPGPDPADARKLACVQKPAAPATPAA